MIWSDLHAIAWCMLKHHGNLWGKNMHNSMLDCGQLLFNLLQKTILIKDGHRLGKPSSVWGSQSKWTRTEPLSQNPCLNWSGSPSGMFVSLLGGVRCRPSAPMLTRSDASLLDDADMLGWHPTSPRSGVGTLEAEHPNWTSVSTQSGKAPFSNCSLGLTNQTKSNLGFGSGLWPSLILIYVLKSLCLKVRNENYSFEMSCIC